MINFRRLSDEEMAERNREEQELFAANPTFVRTTQDDTLQKLAEVLRVDAIRITYTVSGIEPLHPDPTVVARMREIGMTKDCGYGCKIYADPLSNVRVLAHNRAYGCPL